MSGNKICPLGTNEKHMMICPKDTCALYDESRECCGLRQIATTYHHVSDKPIATLNEDGTITGEWAGGKIVGGWSQGTDKKGGADNDENRMG